MEIAEILRRTGSSPGCLQCRGLTAVLKDRYYSDYQYQGGAMALGTEKTGWSRGRVVDNEVHDWIKNRTNFKSKSKSNGIKRKLTKKWEDMHSFSRAFIELTRRLKLTPVGTQVVVRSKDCDLATLIDAVFLNEHNNIVLVELKCGFNGYIDTASGLMSAPFSRFKDSPKYQHQLQLGFTKQMFHKTFPEFNKVDAMVVRMTESGAYVNKINKNIDEIAKRIILLNKRV